MMLTSLNLKTDLNSDDINFLKQFYKFENTSLWDLSKENDIFKLTNNSKQLSFQIDFQTGKYRHRSQIPVKEPLLEAIKIKGKLPRCVIDTTPGCLKDGFLMSSRQIEIIAIERNPLIFFLLKQALTKVKHNIELIFGDAKIFLENESWILDKQPNLIYLDPIYPEKTKAALAKKEMRILKELVGNDLDANQLFEAARQSKTRIVVKRPSYAEYIANLKPSHIIQIGKTRFDVYI